MAQQQQSASMPAQKPAPHPSEEEVLDAAMIERHRQDYGADSINDDGTMSAFDQMLAHK